MESITTKLRPLSVVARVEDACTRAVASPSFAPLLLAAIVGLELGIVLLKAGEQPLWYDELFTFHVSALQPFSHLWKALEEGVDPMPPGYYLIIQLARRLPGDSHMTVRLPSILGYILTLLGIYWFASKRLPALTALTAVLVASLSPLRGFALQARSYCLMVGFLAISAVLWQRIGERRFATPLFAVFLALAVSSHHYSVITLSCFGAAELAWTLLMRRIRWGVWTSCLFATAPFLVGLPLLLRFGEIYRTNFWARPSWSTALWTYKDYLGLGVNFALVLLFFIAIAAGDTFRRMSRLTQEGPPRREFSPPELILLSSFLCYPALLVVLTKLFGGGYTFRYGWPAILGLVLGSTYLFRASRLTSAHLLGVFLIVFALRCGYDFSKRPEADSLKVNERWAQLVEHSRDEPGAPIVIASGLTYVEAAEYAPPELRSRLVTVVDADLSSRLIGTDTTDKANRILARFIPLRVEDRAAFEAAHERFLIASGGINDWFTQYLARSRYHLKLLSKDGDSSLYIAER